MQLEGDGKSSGIQNDLAEGSSERSIKIFDMVKLFLSECDEDRSEENQVEWLPELLVDEESQTEQPVDCMSCADERPSAADPQRKVFPDGSVVEYEPGLDGKPREKSISYRNGMVCNYAYDPDGNLKALTVTDPNGTILLSANKRESGIFEIQLRGCEPMLGDIKIREDGTWEAKISNATDKVQLSQNALFLDYTTAQGRFRTCLFSDGSTTNLKANGAGEFNPAFSRCADGTTIRYGYDQNGELNKVEEIFPNEEGVLYERCDAKDPNQVAQWKVFKTDVNRKPVGEPVRTLTGKLKLDERFHPPEIKEIPNPRQQTENTKAILRINAAQRTAGAYLDEIYDAKINELETREFLAIVLDMQNRKGKELTEDDYKEAKKILDERIKPQLEKLKQEKEAKREQLREECRKSDEAAKNNVPAETIWQNSPVTRELYKDAVRYMESEGIPKVLNHLCKSSGGTVLVGCPIQLKVEKDSGLPESPAAFYARNGGDFNNVKADLVADPNKLPTEQDLERLKAAAKWANDTTKAEARAKVSFQLKEVLPQIIKVGGYPPEWLEQLAKGDPERTHAAASISIANCGRIRRYAKDVELIGKDAGIPLPPYCRWEKINGRDVVVVDYPKSIDPKENSEVFAKWDAWVAKNGARVDELTEQRKQDFAVRYGEDTRFGEFGVEYDANGQWTGKPVYAPKREQFSNDEKGAKEFKEAAEKFEKMDKANLVRGDMKVEVRNGRYFVTVTETVKFSGRANYKNIGANEVGKREFVLGPKDKDGKPIGFERGDRIKCKGWMDDGEWVPVEDCEHWRFLRQLTFHAGDGIEVATDVAMVASAVYTGGTSTALWFSGVRVSGRVLIPALIRGGIGGSGIFLNNANAEVNMPTAVKIRGFIMLVDLFHGSFIARGKESSAMSCFKKSADDLRIADNRAGQFYRNAMYPIKYVQDSKVHQGVQFAGSAYYGTQSSSRIFQRLGKIDKTEGASLKTDDPPASADALRDKQRVESVLSLVDTTCALLGDHDPKDLSKKAALDDIARRTREAKLGSSEVREKYKAELVNNLENPDLDPDIKLASATALLALSTDKDGRLPANGVLFKTDTKVRTQGELSEYRTVSKEYTIKDLAESVRLQSNSDCTARRIVASELLTRLGEQSAFKNVATLSKVLDDPFATSKEKAYAIVQLGSYLHTIRYLEQNAIPTMSTDDRLNYQAQSYGVGADELERKLASCASDPSRPKDLRLLACLVLHDVDASSDENDLDKKLNARATAWSEGAVSDQNRKAYEEKSINQLKEDLRTGDKKSKIESIIALRRLNVPSPSGDGTYNSELVSIIEEDLDRRTVDSETARAINLIDTTKGITPGQRSVLCQVLNDRGSADAAGAKIAVCKRIKFFARSDEDRKQFANAINVMLANPYESKAYPVNSPELREAVAEAIGDLGGYGTDPLRRLMIAPKPGATPFVDYEPDARVRLAALKSAERLQVKWFPEVCRDSMRYERDFAVRARLIDVTVTQKRPVMDDEYFLKRSENGALIIDKFRTSNIPTDRTALNKLNAKAQAILPDMPVLRTTVMVERNLKKEAQMAQREPTKNTQEQPRPGVLQPFRAGELDSDVKWVPVETFHDKEFDQYFLDRLVTVALTDTKEGEEARLVLAYLAYSDDNICRNGPKGPVPLDPESRQRVRVLALQGLDKCCAPGSPVRSKSRLLLETMVYDKSVDPAVALACLEFLEKNCLNTPEERRRLGLLAAYAFAHLTQRTGNAPDITNTNLEGRAKLCTRLLDTIKRFPTQEGFAEIDAYANLDDKDIIAEFKELHAKAKEARVDLCPGVSKLWESTKPATGSQADKARILQDAMMPEQLGFAGRIFRRAEGRPAETTSKMSTQKMFEACKGDPIASPQDLRLGWIKMGLRGREPRVATRPAPSRLDRKESNPFEKKDRDGSERDGSDQFRLGAALIVLQPENTAFSEDDRIEALTICADLMFDPLEHGLSNNAGKLFGEALEKRPNEAIAAAATLILEDHPNSAELSAIIAKKIGPYGKVEVNRADGTRLVVRTFDGKVVVEKFEGNKLLKYSCDPKLNYADITVRDAGYEIDPAKRFAIYKRIIEDDRVGASLFDRLLALEEVKTMANGYTTPKAVKSDCEQLVLAVGPSRSGGFETKTDDGIVVQRLYNRSIVTEKFDRSGNLVSAEVNCPLTPYASTIMGKWKGTGELRDPRSEMQTAKQVLESEAVVGTIPVECKQSALRTLWHMALDKKLDPEVRKDCIRLINKFDKGPEKSFHAGYPASRLFLEGDDSALDLIKSLDRDERLNVIGRIAYPDLNRDDDRIKELERYRDDIDSNLKNNENDPEKTQFWLKEKARVQEEIESLKPTPEKMLAKEARAKRIVDAFLVLQATLDPESAASAENDAAVLSLYLELEQAFGPDHPLTKKIDVSAAVDRLRKNPPVRPDPRRSVSRKFGVEPIDP